MFKSLKPLSLAALLALGAPLSAQETDTGSTETTEGAAGLDMGQEVADGPQLGERYSREKFGEWDLACIKTQAETDPCSMLQILNGADENPMAEITMFRIDQTGGQAVAGASVIVPLETLLPAGLTISIDGAPAKRYNFNFCNQIGCIANIGLSQGDIDALKKGSTATLALRPAPAPDQLIELTMSLKGFTAAYDAVDVVSQ